MATIVYWVILPLCLAFIGTALARYYALKRKLLDEPGERRSHQITTPRGGGIAIVLTVLLVCLWTAITNPTLRLPISGFSIGLILVAAIGWIDDHKPLSAPLRLLIHTIAAAILAVLVFKATGQYAYSLLTFIISISLINIWNFMDGINGLATSQAILAALLYTYLLPSPLNLLSLAFAAACLGFLPFNFPKAKIFMGDVGSGALGYILAAILILACLTTKRHLLPLLLPISVFCIDAGLTLITRVLKRQAWWQAHTNHLYQQLVKAGRSHTNITIVYATFTLLSGIILWLSNKLNFLTETTFSLLWLIALIGLWL